MIFYILNIGKRERLVEADCRTKKTNRRATETNPGERWNNSFLEIRA